MSNTPTPTEMEVSLEWAVQKFGPDFFNVFGQWEKNPNVYRDEQRNRQEDDRTGFALPNIQASLRNIGRILKGQDVETVRVYAELLAVRIVPKRKRMTLANPVKLQAYKTEKENCLPAPPKLDHTEILIPTYGIAATYFDAYRCWTEVMEKLAALKLPEPEMEISPYWPKNFYPPRYRLRP